MALKNSRIDSQHRRLLARLRGFEFLLPERWGGGDSKLLEVAGKMSIWSIFKKNWCCTVASHFHWTILKMKTLKFSSSNLLNFLVLFLCVIFISCPDRSSAHNVFSVWSVQQHRICFVCCQYCGICGSDWADECSGAPYPIVAWLNQSVKLEKQLLGVCGRGFPPTLEVQFWEGHCGGGMLEFGESQTR